MSIRLFYLNIIIMMMLNYSIEFLKIHGTSQPVSECLEKLKIVCELLGITELHRIVPLRLKDEAFAVYQQLTAQQKESVTEIKNALLSVFAFNRFQAY